MATKKFSDYAVQGQNVTLTYDNVNDTVTFDVVVDKTDVGLGNVDNTSDANKPISTATQTALNLKQNSLVSGTNIKTVNSNTLLGSGDVVIDKTSVGLSNVANVDTTNATNISSGTLGDARLSANVTLQGNTFNAANKLVQLDGSAKLPAVDGSQLTNLPTPATPTLASVTTAGNTTTNAITVGGLTVATNLIYTDIVNGRVGIGTTSPASGHLMTVNGNLLISSAVLQINRNLLPHIAMNASGANYGLIQNQSATSWSLAYGSGNNTLGTAVLTWFGGTGNVAINTTTDAGYKLDVNGTARVQGRVILGSSAYLVSGSSLDTSVKISCPAIVNNDGASGLNISNGNFFQDFSVSSSASVLINAVYPLWQTRQYSSLSIVHNIGVTGTPTTATYKSINSTQTVNQTLGTGKIWGLYINHTITAAADHTIAEFIQGTNSIQFIQNNSSSLIALNSTTKGVLFPRMTTTQKNAIATPAAGLVVYDTTLAKLCVYTSAWQTITSI